jgi:hypothetical protein
LIGLPVRLHNYLTTCRHVACALIAHDQSLRKARQTYR